MMTFIKVLFIIVSLLLLFFPLFPFPLKLRKLSTFRRFRYDAPHNRLNAAFILLTILEFIGIAVVYGVLFSLASAIASIPFIAKLLQNFSNTVAFNSNVLFRVLLLNVVTLYAFLFLKAFVKRVLDEILGFREKKEKKNMEKIICLTSRAFIKIRLKMLKKRMRLFDQQISIGHQILLLHIWKKISLDYMN